jgi:parallel beta-helix repeat protein
MNFNRISIEFPPNFHYISMSFKKYNKIRKVLLAILPGILVAALVFGANVYYDLDLGKVIIQEITKIIGMFETTATTTLATSGAYVGVGTSTLPSYTLDVSGALRLMPYSQPTGANGVVYYDLTANRFKCYQNGAWVNCVGEGGSVGGSGTQNYLAKWTATTTLGNSIVLDNGSLVSVLGQFTTQSTTTLATSTGYVGIGTATPSEKLTVYGNILGSGNIILQSGSYNLTLTPAALSSNQTITFPNLSGTVAVSSTAPITLSSTGVIGLTTPLAISFGGTATSSIGSAGSVVYSNGTTYAFTSVGTAGQPLLSGGSGAPTWGTLSVSYGGTGLTSVASGALLFGSGGTALNTLSIGSANTILASNGSAPYWSSLSSLSIPTGTGAANYITKWTGANTLATSTITDDGSIVNIPGTTTLATASGRVGIGTSSPAYLLDVYSAGGNTIRLGASSTDTVLVGGGSGKLTVGVVDPWLIQNTSLATTTLYIRTSSTTGADDIVFQTAGTNERMRILENGNVGIGTTSPASKLTVIGTDTTEGQLRVGYDSSNYLKLVVTSDGSVTFTPIGTFPKITFASNVIVDTDKTLKLSGGTSFPSSPTEGEMFFRTDLKQLYVYANSKWQADRTVATKIVAATSSQNYEKADYVCSGSSCEDEINTALSALPSSGGIVYLLEGTYIMATSTYSDCSIKMSTSTALIGAGPATVLKIKDSFNADLKVICNSDTTNGNSRILLSNFRLDGNKANNTSGYQYGIYFYKVGSGTGSSALPGAKIEKLFVENFRDDGIYFYYSDNNTISGNTFQGNVYGIYIQSSSNNTISGNTSQGNYYYGIYIGFSSNNNTISGNTVQGNSTGIYLHSSYNNTISGNTSQGNGGSGIYVWFADNNTISGNTFQGNAHGILIESSSNNTISGNTSQGNIYYGIFIESSSNNNVISGNKVHDNGGSASYDGIKIYNDSDSNLISSNDITDTAGTGYAINIADSTCDNNYLVGNRYSGTGASSINDAGTGTIYGSQLFGDSASANLILKPLGNVGIGTTGPTSLLELYKTDASPILTITSATSTTYSPQIAFRTGTTPSTQFTLGVDIGDSNKFKIATSSFPSTAVLTIDQTGKVGIGTTAPSLAKLQVQGGVIRVENAASQDAVVLAGRAGGTGSYAVTITPTTLTGNRTLTLADADTTLVGGTMVPTTRTISTTSPLSGGGDLSADRTLSLAGLNSLGTANYVVGVNSGATAWEYKNILGTANEIDITHAAGSITIGLVDPLILSKGGTGANLTAVQGGVVYSGASALAISAAGTAGQALISGGTGAPTWFNPTAGSVIFAGSSGVLSQDNANLFWDNTNKRLGIGTTGPDRKLDVLDNTGNPQLRLTYTDGSVYTDFFTSSTGILIIDTSLTNDTVYIGPNPSATGTLAVYKITTYTLDPLYTINGKTFATYAPSMTGVKEETTGVIKVEKMVEGKDYYQAEIDFNNLEEGSDLWLFSKVTNLKKNIDKLTVLLTPASRAKVWYQVDPQNFKLYFFAEKPTTISYRLTAPRFDWEKWKNVPEDSDNIQGLVVNEDGLVVSSSTVYQYSEENNDEGILEKAVSLVKEALEKLGLLIENGIAQIKEIITEKLSAKVVVTNQLCLGQTCIDEAKLKELLEKTGTIGTANNQAASNGAANNGTTSNETVSNQPANNGTTNNEATSSEQQTMNNEQSVSEDIPQATSGSQSESNETMLSNEQSSNEQLNSEQSGNGQSEPSTTTAQ